MKPIKSNTPLVHNADRAPIIDVDGALCYGICNGIITIGTVATVFVPVDVSGQVPPKPRPLITGHIRGGIEGMRSLRECIDTALKQFEVPARKN